MQEKKRTVLPETSTRTPTSGQTLPTIYSTQQSQAIEHQDRGLIHVRVSVNSPLTKLLCLLRVERVHSECLCFRVPGIQQCPPVRQKTGQKKKKNAHLSKKQTITPTSPAHTHGRASSPSRVGDDSLLSNTPPPDTLFPPLLRPESTSKLSMPHATQSPLSHLERDGACRNTKRSSIHTELCEQ